MKNAFRLLSVSLLFSCNIVVAQESDLEKDKTWKRDQQAIHTLKDVETYDLKHPEIKAMVYSEVVSKDSVEIIRKAHHNVLYYGHSLHRVIDIQPLVQMRASHIFLDGNKMPLAEINKKRDEILKFFRQGKPFSELAEEYTMDPSSKSGDLGWFTRQQMFPEFGEAVSAHHKGEIFPVDIARKDWYFVVLKTEDNQTRYEISIVQINQ